MAEVTGAGLENIYNRLSGVSGHHPFDADTVSADWSIEAGDIVKVKRGDETYTSPLHSTSLTWRGAPEMTLSSTGNKERDAIAKVSKRKYARGGGYMNDQRFYKTFYDAYEGLYSYIEMTSSRLYTTFEGMYDGLSSEFEITRSRMYADFKGMYDGLSSSFEITRSRMYADFNGLYDGLSSQFEVTRSRMYMDFKGLYDGLGSEFEITRSRMYAEFHGLYDGLSSEFELTRSRMYADFKGLYDGLGSEFELTRSRMYVDFYGLYDGLSSSFEVTRSRMYADFKDLYDGLSSSFEVTRSRMYIDFSGMYDGLSSSFEVTRSRMYVDFYGLYDGLGSTFEVTRSRMYVDFYGLYDGLGSTFEVTRSRMYAQFSGLYDGLSSSFEVTRSRMYTQFTDLYGGLSSEFEVTSSRLSNTISNYYTNLRSRIIQESDRIGLVVEGTGNNAHIKAAQIVASINDDGTSQTLLSADKITLDGNTLLSGTLNVISGGIASSGNIQAGLSADNFIRGKTLKLLGASSSQGAQEVTLGYGDVDGMIIKAEVDSSTNTLKLWKHGDSTAGEPSITFSKAASGNKVSGSWSGKTLTVVPSQTGSDSYISTINTGLVEDTNTTPHTFHITAYHSDNGAQSQTEIQSARTQYTLGTLAATPKIVRILNASGSTYINGTATYTIPLQTKTISSNGSDITPDDGYVGFSSVTVSVNPVVGSTFVKDGSTYYVSATKDGTEVTTARKQIVLARSGTTVQIEDGHGTARANTPTYTIPLTTQTISSNGTYSPTSSYVGFSSVTVSVSDPVVGSTFVKSGSTYYVSATKDGTEVTTARKQIALARSGTTVQIEDGQGTVRSNTPTYTIPLQDKTGTNKITANGTYNPASGYVGFSSVEIDVAGADPVIGSTFVNSGSTYYVSATKDGTEVTTARKQIALKVVDSNVVIYDGQSTVRDNTPSLALSLDTGTLTSGSRTVTVKAGGAATSVTATISDYGDGWSGCYSDIGLNYSTDQTISPGSSITVYPAAKPTPSGTHASITSKGITVSASSPSYSLTASSVTVADVGAVSGFEKYGSGESTYYLNTSGGVRVYTTPSMMVDGHSLTGDNTILVQVPTAVYAKGWTAAYGKVSIPSSSSYGESTSVSTPPSTVGGDPVTTQFDLSVDNNYAYIKKHSNAQTLARVSNTGYANGWGGCYADIGLNYSSNQTISPGSSITVYPAAKPTPSGSHASITTKGITVSASSPSYSVTASSVTVADVGSVSNFTKNGSGESTWYITGSGTSAGVRVYTTPSMTVDGHALSGSNTILVSVPTNIYVTGYSAGEDNCWSNTTIEWGSATWDKSGSGSSTSIHMYIPANIKGPNSKSKAANSNWYSVPKNIWADGWQSAWGEIIFDYYPNNDYFQIYYPTASAGVPSSTPAKYTISASNGTAKVTYDGTGETVCQTTYSTSSYPYTKTLTCNGATFTQNQWKYTFEWWSSTSGLFTTGNSYKFHNNSSYT